ncbi:MAG: DUF896 domain-containing protein [Eubacterium sp.]|nr:DUF896 domain-containing protein [Eubacterium sp.]MDE6864181.1 DUF896 domain-containing protein [Eubacterium sp.]
MTQEKINRINELAHKSKTVGLTDEEKQEQAVLRREYIDSFKASLVGQLENTYIIDEKGNKRKVQKKNNGKTNYN